MRKLLNDLSEKPSVLFEIFGCYRHFGHPTIDEIEGLKNLKETTRKHIEIDDDICKQVSGAFKKKFVINFIRTLAKMWYFRKRTAVCKIQKDYREPD